MQNTIDVENMAKLIDAYDAFEVIAGSIEKIIGEDYRFGKLGNMYQLLSVIESFTVLDTEPDDSRDEMSEFDRVILDTEKSSIDRAKRILGVQLDKE